MKTVAIWVAVILVALAVFVGVYLGIAVLCVWLYGGLAPQGWVRPTLLQWIGIIFLVTVLFGGSGATVARS